MPIAGLTRYTFLIKGLWASILRTSDKHGQQGLQKKKKNLPPDICEKEPDCLSQQGLDHSDCIVSNEQSDLKWQKHTELIIFVQGVIMITCIRGAPLATDCLTGHHQMLTYEKIPVKVFLILLLFWATNQIRVYKAWLTLAKPKTWSRPTKCNICVDSPEETWTQSSWLCIDVRGVARDFKPHACISYLAPIPG